MFAAKIAATATVVPKSAKESILLPLDATASPKLPDQVGNEEDDRRLVKAIEHVEPELGPRILQASDATNIELRESKCSF